MLRILIISVGKMSGGIEKYTVTLGKLLEKERMKVYYVVRKGGWLEGQLHEKNVLHVEMGKHIISDVFRIRRFAQKNKINIVHCNSNNGLLMAILVTENRDRKKIGVIHGDVKVDQAQKGIFIVSLYSKLEKWLLNMTCSKCVAVSQSMKNILKEHGVKESKISVIYNGIQHWDYVKTPDYYATPLKICTVGNLVAVKNHIALLEALLVLKRQYAYVNVLVDIYGEGPLRVELDSFIRENGLENVRLKGFTDKVRERLNQYVLYVHPSNYESFGISIVEAMQAGCCVIANDVGGIKEIIQDENGYLVDCNQIDELANRIAYCYMKRDELKQKAIKGKRKSEENFTDIIMMKRVLELYHEVNGK